MNGEKYHVHVLEGLIFKGVNHSSIYLRVHCDPNLILKCFSLV